MIKKPTLENISDSMELMHEIKLHLSDKKRFYDELKMLNKSYQKGQFGYVRYKLLKEKHLKGKTKKEWDAYYDSYLYGLLKRLEYHNSRVFYDVFTDKTRLKIKIPSKKKKAKEKVIGVEVKVPKATLPSIDEMLEQRRKKRKVQTAVQELESQMPTIKKMIEERKKAKAVFVPVEKTPKPFEPVAEPEPEPDRPVPETNLKTNLEVEAANKADLDFNLLPEGDENATPDLIDLKPAALEPKNSLDDSMPEMPEGSKTEDVVDARVVGDVPDSPELVLNYNEEDEEFGYEKRSIDAERVEDLPEPEPEILDEKDVWEDSLFGKQKKISLILGKKKPDDMSWLDQGEPKKSKFKAAWDYFVYGKKKNKSAIKSEETEEPLDDQTELEFKGIFSIPLFRRLVSQRRIVSDKTELATSMIALKRFKDKHNLVEDSTEKLNTSALLEEARRIKTIIKKSSQFHVYKHSTIGTIANLTVKRISLFMIETFPDFFKAIYDNLRFADIKILSNTYVNIMFLSSIITFLVSYTLSALVMGVQSISVLLVLVRALISASFFGAIAFISFYIYPKMRIKQRRRSINANLPFAINHMSAVSSSGVPPDTMFGLISQSKEYQEVSIEISKVTDHIDVFGYDIITAIKSVAATTPSPRLKEFFEGFVATVETGGDLKSYLTQRAEEAMLQYKLERQKYLESISTYSDIYTGLLIAAPLFFVVALSLLSILGGNVGGFDVNTLIAVGTYAIIPLLNFAFIIFLEASQPEV